MNTEDYFFNINVPVNFIDNLYKELEHANWYTSVTNQCRSDIIGETRSLIEEYMPFKVYCCGFFKNVPGWTYPIHKDFQRRAAVNIQLVDDSDEFKIYSYSDDLKQVFVAPYSKNKPILLNTKKFHQVHNTSKDKIRYILSVGCIEESYEVIKDRFKELEKV